MQNVSDILSFSFVIVNLLTMVLCTNMAVSSRQEYHTDQLDSVKGFLSLTVAPNYPPGRPLSSLCAHRDQLFISSFLNVVLTMFAPQPEGKEQNLKRQLSLI